MVSIVSFHVLCLDIYIRNSAAMSVILSLPLARALAGLEIISPLGFLT